MILKKATVLIVDDDPDVLTAVKLLLKPEAREIITEKNPENLNWLLQRNEVDLILLDMAKYKQVFIASKKNADFLNAKIIGIEIIASK